MEHLSKLNTGADLRNLCRYAKSCSKKDFRGRFHVAEGVPHFRQRANQ